MTDTAHLLIDSRCELGEGPLWHPQRQQLFYFDINRRTLFSASAGGSVEGRWPLDEMASAAAVIDEHTLMLATESGLKRFDLLSRMSETIVAIEADKPGTRSNDGRCHPSGGYWIGTIGKDSEEDPQGTLYHYRAGELTVLKTPVAIPNATCFSPDGAIAYWTDTPTKRILKCPVDPATGLPNGEWSLFVEVPEDEGYPDGAVVDSAGYLWSARWGGHRVVRHAPDGSVDRVVHVPVSQVSCPALGGPELKTLFITTAAKNLSAEQLASEKVAGGVFAIEVDVPGQPEPVFHD